MKYIALTFDDGRADNYSAAAPIMSKYGINATFFVTSGYIDGTWQKSSDWKSASGAMSVDNLRELQSSGFEIAIHGDKHITDVDDFNAAYNKMLEWGLCGGEPVGYSIPCSNVSEDVLNDFKDKLLNKKVAYIRGGRRTDTKKFSSKILFGMYTYLNSQSAFNKFNSYNIESLNKFDNADICSLVVRCSDKPKMIVDFIDRMPDNSFCTFMLHSILDESDRLYGADPWNFSKKSFENLCSGLSQLDVKSECLSSIINTSINK